MNTRRPWSATPTECLARTRWPDELPGVGAGYGVQLGHLKDFHDHGHAHRRADLSTFGCVVRDGVRSARLGGGGLDPRHPQELRTRSKRGESRMKFVGLDYGLQPRSPGLLSRTSAVVQAPFENSRIDSLSTGRPLPSSCCLPKIAPIMWARTRERSCGEVTKDRPFDSAQDRVLRHRVWGRTRDQHRGRSL